MTLALARPSPIAVRHPRRWHTSSTLPVVRSRSLARRSAGDTEHHGRVPENVPRRAPDDRVTSASGRPAVLKSPPWCRTLTTRGKSADRIQISLDVSSNTSRLRGPVREAFAPLIRCRMDCRTERPIVSASHPRTRSLGSPVLACVEGSRRRGSRRSALAREHRDASTRRASDGRGWSPRNAIDCYSRVSTSEYWLRDCAS